MSFNEYKKEILAYIEKNVFKEKVKPRQLARQMGVLDSDYGVFRAAFKKLRAEGRLVLGGPKALTFPNGDTTMVGTYQATRGTFGFVVPEDPTNHADLFVPEGKSAGARDGDLVVARIVSDPGNQPEREDKPRSGLKRVGEIVEIKERGNTHVVGQLEQAENRFFVIPDGRRFSRPVMVRDVPVEYRKPGLKVMADIIWEPDGEGVPEGVIVKAFGEAGVPATEIASVMAAYGLPEAFSPGAIADAEAACAAFEPGTDEDRMDLTDTIVVTIDPDSARDYDDAISLDVLGEGRMRLGVHIADVSYFVKEGTSLDEDARLRGLSVYFPRFVVPMLPPMLSNSICSLQEDVDRYCVSIFIDYDADGQVIDRRPARTRIRSAKRFTYTEAQSVIDTGKGECSAETAALLGRMDALAKKIEARKKKAGMIHLDLPEVELLLDDTGAVVGATRADNSYTHKIVEMFMVEANEQVAEILDSRNAPFVRRIHPKPDDASLEQLSRFVGACGYKLSPQPSLQDIGRLVDDAHGQPASYAVNLAVLRSFQRAVYSIESEGHFALAIRHYCHFTSPIRRYPDLLIHRQLVQVIQGKKLDKSDAAATQMTEDAAFFSTRERSSQSAEMELRLVLVLLYLQQHKGELFNGVITGVTDFGLFVQHPDFLIEGLVRLPDLGDDWWEVTSDEGKVRGDFTGKVFKIGDTLEVRIDRVNLARRQLEISPSYAPEKRHGFDDPLDGVTGRPSGAEAKSGQASRARKPRGSAGLHLKSKRTREARHPSGTRRSGRKR